MKLNRFLGVIIKFYKRTNFNQPEKVSKPILNKSLIRLYCHNTIKNNSQQLERITDLLKN